MIPASNCADTLAGVVASVPRGLFRTVIVVVYGSLDGTAQVARDAGATVLRQSRGGYGAACKRAQAHLEALPTPPDIVVFSPPRYALDSQDLKALVSPIEGDNAELVLGAREQRQTPKRTYVRLSRRAISLVYRHHLDDVGPSRAIRFPALVALSLTETSEAWNVEMVVKALAFGLHIVEVPVSGWASSESGKGSSKKPRRLRASLSSTSRALYLVLRHSTTR